MIDDVRTTEVSPPLASPATWLQREKERLRAEHPRLDRAVRAVWARPAGVLLPLAFVVLGCLGAVIPHGDARWFRRAGASMLTPSVWDVFAEAGLQIGPAYLLLLGLASLAVRLMHLPELFVLAGAQAALVTWLALVTARRVALHAGARHLPVQWAVGTCLVLGGLLAESIGNGHPEEIVLGLLFVLTALAAVQGHGVRVGVLVALATGLKLWGVLGSPVALLGRNLRQVLVAGTVALALTALTYLPFHLWGEVNTFSFSWGVAGSSPLGRLAALGMSDWALRVVQGAACVVVGCVVSLRRHGSPLTAVLCILCARLLLDPLRLTYYSGPVVVVALLWAWTSGSPAVRRWRLAATAFVPLLVVLPYLISRAVVMDVSSLLLVALPVAVLWIERRTRGPAVPVQTHVDQAAHRVGSAEVHETARAGETAPADAGLSSQ